MFKTSAPVAEPAPDVVASPPTEPVPLSVLELDLPAPTTGWLIELDRRGIPIVLDDLGRKSISRADAKMLITEKRENELRQREAAARNEQRAVEADKAWRSQLPVGLPWYDAPVDVLPVVAMTAAARDESPRKRSMVEDLLDRRNTMVFHPMQGDES